MPCGNWPYQKRTADIAVIAAHLKRYADDYPFDSSGHGKHIANSRYATDRYPHMVPYWESVNRV
jgi:hypothetical protein